MKTKICAALAMTAIIGFSSISVYADDEIGDGCPDVDDEGIIDDNYNVSDDWEDDQGNTYYYDDDGNIYYLDREGNKFYRDDDGNYYYLDDDGKRTPVDEDELMKNYIGESIPLDDEYRCLYYDDNNNLYFPDRDGNKYYLLFEDGRGWYYLAPDGIRYYYDDYGRYSFTDEDGNKHYVNRDGYYWLYDKDSEVWYYLDSEGNKYVDDDNDLKYCFIDGNGNEHYPNFDKDKYYPVGTSPQKTSDISDKTDIAEEPNPKTGNNGFPAAAVTACALAAAALLKAKENLK